MTGQEILALLVVAAVAATAMYRWVRSRRRCADEHSESSCHGCGAASGCQVKDVSST